MHPGLREAILNKATETSKIRKLARFLPNSISRT